MFTNLKSNKTNHLRITTQSVVNRKQNTSNFVPINYHIWDKTIINKNRISHIKILDLGLN